jgi:hypothetical protein
VGQTRAPCTPGEDREAWDDQLQPAPCLDLAETFLFRPQCPQLRSGAASLHKGHFMRVKRRCAQPGGHLSFLHALCCHSQASATKGMRDPSTWEQVLGPRQGTLLPAPFRWAMTIPLLSLRGAVVTPFTCGETEARKGELPPRGHTAAEWQYGCAGLGEVALSTSSEGGAKQNLGVETPCAG